MTEPGGHGGNEELARYLSGLLARRARREVEALLEEAFEEAREEVEAALRIAARQELLTALEERLGDRSGRPQPERASEEGGNNHRQVIRLPPEDEQESEEAPPGRHRAPLESFTDRVERRGPSGERRPPDAGAFESGAYLYAVTWTDVRVPTDINGVDGGGLRAVDIRPLRAVVSDVDPGAFDEEAFARRVGDTEWVERRVRAHDDVLRRLLAMGTLIPLRFGTIVATDEEVRTVLREHQRELHRTLHRLEDAAEWGVKGYWSTEDLHAHVAAKREREDRALEEAPGNGTSYLLGRQREREVSAEAERVHDAVLNECHQRLSEAARDAALLPLRSDEGARDGESLVLNGSYLVANDRLEAFRSVVQELSATYGDAGLRLETTGPWPPYSFVGSTALEEAHV